MGTEHEAEVRRRLTNIEQKTDAMQDSLTWLVRANAKELLPRLLAEFGKGERRIAVYLALDGQRSVNDIASYLGMKPENVSIELRWLRGKSLVRIRKVSGVGKRYVKEDFDGVVELSHHLERRLKEIQKKKTQAKQPSAKAVAKARK